MLPENPETSLPERLPYERPTVVEDLPLETYSLACDPNAGGKNAGACDQQGFALS